MNKKILLISLILTTIFFVGLSAFSIPIPTHSENFVLNLSGNDYIPTTQTSNNQSISSYTIEGNSVFIEDEQASLRVTPHTARFPTPEGYKQEFEICNKTGITTNLYGAYVFNYDLIQAKAEYLISEGYEWIEHKNRCPFEVDVRLNVNPEPNIHQIDCYYMDGDTKIIDFTKAIKSGDIETGIFQYDVEEWVKNWNNVTTSFEKKNINGKSVYVYTSGKEVLGNDCETWKITYEPNPNDKTEKWDLWLWVDSGGWDCILTDTCQKTLKLDPWWDGAGSEGDPFIITDCNQLQTMDSYRGGEWNETPNGPYFELGNDIDCSEFGNFDPIGADGDNFHGHFDGKNYSISNLTMNTSANDNSGMFERVGASAEIKNVALIDFNVWNSSNTATVVVGTCSGEAMIENIYVQGAVVSGDGTNYVSGFAGLIQFGCKVKNSYVIDSSIKSSGVNYVGGFAGGTFYADSNVINCYSNASVVGNTAKTGAFIGDAYNPNECSNCFYDTDTAIETDNSCGTGKTTLEMYKQATFTNWDFTTVWSIDEDVDYPRLISFISDPCSCPASGNWEITSGDVCTLSTECNLSAGSLHIIEGSLNITSTGTLTIPSGEKIVIEKDNNISIENGGTVTIHK